MQEHNFEKQVQQKMDELSITPSAPVWQKVEMEIRKKKDRRRFVFWMLPLLLIGGGLSWWALQMPEGAAVATTKANKPAPGHESSRSASAPVETQKNAPKETLPEGGDRERKPDFELTTRKKNTYNRLSQPMPLRSSSPTVMVSDVPETKDEAVDYGRIDEKSPTEVADRVAFQPTFDVAADSSRSSASPLPVDQARAEDPKEPQKKENGNDSLVVRATTKTAEAKKWKWDLHASVGISAVKRGLFHSNTMSLDYYQGPGTGGMVVTPPPSQVRSGMTYSFGVTAKRTISRRMSLSGGIQYHLFSTRIATGAQIRRDTVVNNNASFRNLSSFYQTGGQKEYQNNYHFVELPVGLEYQLSRKWPLRLHAGLVLGQLISTNALVYDRWNNIYYKDNSVLNKTQLQFFANLNYKILEWNKRSLHAGPYLQYGFPGLEKAEQGKRYHLFSTGVRTYISF